MLIFWVWLSTHVFCVCTCWYVRCNDELVFVQRECAGDILLCQMAACVVVTCGPLTEALRGYKAQLQPDRKQPQLEGAAACTLQATPIVSWLPDASKPDRNCRHIESFVHGVSQRLQDSARKMGSRCVLCTEQAAWWCAELPSVLFGNFHARVQESADSHTAPCCSCVKRVVRCVLTCDPPIVPQACRVGPEFQHVCCEQICSCDSSDGRSACRFEVACLISEHLLEHHHLLPSAGPSAPDGVQGGHTIATSVRLFLHLDELPTWRFHRAAQAACEACRPVSGAMCGVAMACEQVLC